MNSDVPGFSSVVGVARQALDGCPELLLPLASGVNGYSSSVVLPGGSGYGSPLSSSPLGIALSLIDKDCPKRASASPLRYSAEDTGHPSGDCCPNPVGRYLRVEKLFRGERPKLSPQHDISPQH
ncbi:hypothetical protein NC652_028704 [Populus alba x Populus x berolinensis]|nr:hypothetical protein NC652_028704 [Populus alba x Populus x berolinensis]